MANPEHVARLKDGVEAWNAWRKQDPGVHPDLSEADLVEANLDGAELNRTDLRQARLRRSILTLANLERARLNDADLGGSDLRRARVVRADLIGTSLVAADLRVVDFSGANLDKADLSHALLQSALLYKTELKGSIITGVPINQTIFSDVDLSEVIGLDLCQFDGPATVGIDTIYRSGEKIPDAFLRGCGVPDAFIVYAKSLVGAAIEFYSAFISYSTKDQDFANRLYADLQASSVRCWFAPEDLKIGDKFRTQIDESIRI